MWCAIANTRLPHRYANDLCQQRLGELAYLGMLFDDGVKRTTEASNDDLITRVLQLRQAAEILVKTSTAIFRRSRSPASVGALESGARNAREAPTHLAQ